MPKPIFTAEDQATVITGIRAVWNGIGHDVLQAGTDCGEAIDATSAVESCIDADRLHQFGYADAQRIVYAAVSAHGYSKVLRELAKVTVLA